ncbi:hypothetical protein FPV67DRAFT_1513585 [Lyophyllum atratum]|nr:hypothetical protein FPV67DRAFT_1513585 [Lyophyllum atratum]
MDRGWVAVRENRNASTARAANGTADSTAGADHVNGTQDPLNLSYAPIVRHASGNKPPVSDDQITSAGFDIVNTPHNGNGILSRSEPCIASTTHHLDPLTHEHVRNVEVEEATGQITDQNKVLSQINTGAVYAKTLDKAADIDKSSNVNENGQYHADNVSQANSEEGSIGRQRVHTVIPVTQVSHDLYEAVDEPQAFARSCTTGAAGIQAIYHCKGCTCNVVNRLDEALGHNLNINGDLVNVGDEQSHGTHRALPASNRLTPP